MPWGLKRHYGTRSLHFITWSCYRRQPLLGTPARRDLVLAVLELMRIRYRFAVIGYVVMPEHVHLLISEPLIGDPSKVVQAGKMANRQPSFHHPFGHDRMFDDCSPLLFVGGAVNVPVDLGFGSTAGAVVSCYSPPWRRISGLVRSVGGARNEAPQGVPLREQQTAAVGLAGFVIRHASDRPENLHKRCEHGAACG